MRHHCSALTSRYVPCGAVVGPACPGCEAPRARPTLAEATRNNLRNMNALLPGWAEPGLPGPRTRGGPRQPLLLRGPSSVDAQDDVGDTVPAFAAVVERPGERCLGVADGVARLQLAAGAERDLPRLHQGAEV